MTSLSSLLSLLAALVPVLVEVWRPVWTRSTPSGIGWFLLPIACLGVVFLLPHRHEGMSYADGVKAMVLRVFQHPLTYVAVGLMLYLAIPLFNVGLCPVCDAHAIAAGASPYPRFRHLPFCVNPEEHLSVVRWFLSAIASALVVRFGLHRKWKLVFCEVMCWNAALVSAWGFVRQFVFDIPAGKGFSVFGYVNHGGSFFVLAFAMSLGLWAMRQAESCRLETQGAPSGHPILSRHYPLAAVGLNALGGMATLCRAAMLFFLFLTIVFCVYVFVAAVARKGRMHRIGGLSSLLLLVALGVAVSVYAPPEIGREFKSLTTQGIVDRAAGRSEYHTRVATAVLRDYPFFGVGGWGYRHFCSSYLKPGELPQYQTRGGANVHNDYLQFAAEHGLLGFALMAGLVVFLVRSVGHAWRAAYCDYRFLPSKVRPISPVVVFAVNPLSFFGVLGCLAVMINALGDCPFRSPAVLAVWMSVLAALPGTIDE